MLARYEEFLRALMPMNVRDLAPDSSVRPQIAEAIRRAFPREILVYHWRDRMPLEDLIKNARERIARSFPGARWNLS